MPPIRKRQNAAVANPLDELRVPLLRRSRRRSRKVPVPVESESQAGPERFAPWYPLLQNIRRVNCNQQCNDISHVPVSNDRLHHAGKAPREEITGIPHPSFSVAPKVFDNHLVPSSEYPAVQLQNGVLTIEMSRPPKNLKWLQMRLKSTRHVPDWPTSKWQSYTMHSYTATTKEAVIFEMMPLFQEFPKQPEYIRTIYQCFDDFPEYAPFTRAIEKPCPGFAQGFRLDAYPCLDIEYVSAAVCFSRDQASLVHPHLAGDFTDGDVKALEATSARHGAALVYMRNLALAHIKVELLEGMAEIMTFTTNGTYINFFAHYAYTSAEGKVEYHQYPIASVNLMGSYFEFIQGVTMLRNCQDHALFMATYLRDELEKYHMRNGTNAWTYHLDEGEHILSESEDSVMERGDCREYGNKGNLKNANVLGESLHKNDETSSDEDGTSMNDADSAGYDDDSLSPSPIRALDSMKLRPRTRAAQKRRAGKSPDETPRKRRR